MMLTQLSTVKARLGLLPTDATYDTQLTQVIAAVSAWFEHETNREFGRQVNTTYEFAADETEIPLPCYPVEQVSRFEYKSDELNGWVCEPTVSFTLRRNCVISLKVAMGFSTEQCRVTYTGGYVLPGDPMPPLLPGAQLVPVPLPPDLEHAAIEQVAFWFQNRDRIGQARVWENQGTYRQFYGDLTLLPSVKKLLGKYRRWRV